MRGRLAEKRPASLLVSVGAIGYLEQLLLNSVPGVQKQYQAVRSAEARQALRKFIPESQAHR